MTRWLAIWLALAIAGCSDPRPAPRLTPAPSPVLPAGTVALDGLTPLGADELTALLKVEHSFRLADDYPGIARTLDFDGKGEVTDGSCDPAACVSDYSIAGNVLTMHIGVGPSRLLFYKSATGTVHVDWENDDEAFARPW